MQYSVNRGSRFNSNNLPLFLMAIEQANNEKELWKVANDVLNPKKENEWKIINKE